MKLFNLMNSRSAMNTRSATRRRVAIGVTMALTIGVALQSFAQSKGRNSGYTTSTRSLTHSTSVLKALENKTLGNRGAFAHSIPIIAVPARHGSEPNLSIDYDSQQMGSSWVGVGWSLELGYIERDGRKGVPVHWTTIPGGENHGETNPFGSREDIPGLHEWYDDDKGFVHDGNRVLPMSDGSFRAEVGSDISDYTFDRDNNKWIYQDGAGNTLHYGETASARMGNYADTAWIPAPLVLGADQEHAVTYRWALDKIVTADGDVTTIEYEKSGAYGMIYPKKIRYNLHVADASLPAFTIRFEKELRPDKRISYRYGFRVEYNVRLKKVICETESLGHVRTYELNYILSNASRRSLLRSVQTLGVDVNNDVMPKVVFNYSDIPSNGGFRFENTVNWDNATEGNDEIEWKAIAGSEFFYRERQRLGGVQSEYLAVSDLVDIDGDGLPDRVRRKKTPWYTSFKIQRNRFGGSGQNAFGGSDGLRRFGDTEDWGTAVHPRDNRNLDVELEKHNVISSVNSSYARFLDIDGDLRPDRIMDEYRSLLFSHSPVNPDTWLRNPYNKFIVALNSGQGFLYTRYHNVNTTSAYDKTEIGPQERGAYRAVEGDWVKLLDINGDGWPDRVMLPYGGTVDDPRRELMVQLNKGRSYSPDTGAPVEDIDLFGQPNGFAGWGNFTFERYHYGWYNSLGEVGHAYTKWDNDRVKIADINGDGLPDRILAPRKPLPSINGEIQRVTDPAEFNKFLIEYGNGYGFEPAEYDNGYDPDTVWEGVDAQAASHPGGRYDFIENWPYVGLLDVNGDKLLDRVMLKEGAVPRWLVQVNDGSRFHPPVEMNNIDRSAGASFGSQSPQSQGWDGIVNSDKHGIFATVCDMNGDGLPDRVLSDRSSGSEHFRVQLNAGTGNNWTRVPDLLNFIDNGLGANTFIQYGSSSRYNNRLDPNDPDSVALLPFPVQVVTGVLTDDGFGNLSRTDFSYEGGFYDRIRQEFSGFAKVTVEQDLAEEVNGNDTTMLRTMTRYWYHQGGGRDFRQQGEHNDTVQATIDGRPQRIGSFAKKGLPFRIDTFGADGLCYNSTFNKIVQAPYGTGGRWRNPLILKTISVDFVGVADPEDAIEDKKYRATALENRTDVTGRVNWTAQYGEVENVRTHDYHTDDSDPDDTIYTHTEYAFLPNGPGTELPDVSNVTLPSSQSIDQENKAGWGGALQNAATTPPGIADQSITKTHPRRVWITEQESLTSKVISETIYFYHPDSLNVSCIAQRINALRPAVSATGNSATIPALPERYANTFFGYDAYHNVTGIRNPDGTEISYSYDPAHQMYPDEERLLDAHADPNVTDKDFVTKYTFEPRGGVPIKVVDLNDIETHTSYDGFFRVKQLHDVYPAQGSDPSQTIIKAKFEYGTGRLVGGVPAGGIVNDVPQDYLKAEINDGLANAGDPTSYQETWTYFNGNGDPVQTRTEAEDGAGGEFRVVLHAYRPDGTPDLDTLPVFSNGSAYEKPSQLPDTMGDRIEVDALGRPQVEYVNGRVTIDSPGRVAGYESTDGDTSGDETSELGPRKWKYGHSHGTYSDGDPWAIVQESPKYDNGVEYKTIVLKDAFGRTIDTTRSQFENLHSLGHHRKVEYDRLGNLLKERSYSHSSTAGAFDMGITSYTYNDLGEPLSKVDTYGGKEEYQRDLAGRVIERLDANNNKIVFEYDTPGGRMSTKKVYNGRVEDSTVNGWTDPEMTYTFHFDTAQANYVPKGQISMIEDKDGDDDKGYVKYIYDNRGRTTLEARKLRIDVSGFKAEPDTLPGMTEQPDFVTQYQFDDLDRLTKLTYPKSVHSPDDTFHIWYEYDEAGNLSKVSESVNGDPPTGSHHYDVLKRDSFGRVTEFKQRNDRKTEYEYYPRSQRLKRIEVDLPGDPLKIGYSYDHHGNISKLVRAGNPKAFSYDSWDRLKKSGEQEFFYDPQGRMHKIEVIGSPDEDSYEFASALPNAVKQAEVDDPNVPNGGRRLRRYNYDAVGHLTRRDFHVPVYNGENRIIQVEGVQPASSSQNPSQNPPQNQQQNPSQNQQHVPRHGGIIAQYGYTMEGNRLWAGYGNDRAASDQDASSSQFHPSELDIWIGEHFEVRGGKTLYHVFAGGKRVAVIEKEKTDEEDQNGDPIIEERRYYYHQDHLDSIAAISAEDGSTVAMDLQYTAFGQYLGDYSTENLGARHLWNGRDLDRGTGLYYLGGDHYAPELGRSLQVHNKALAPAHVARNFTYGVLDSHLATSAWPEAESEPGGGELNSLLFHLTPFGDAYLLWNGHDVMGNKATAVDYTFAVIGLIPGAKLFTGSRSASKAAKTASHMCFVAGTKVVAESGHVNIEDIKVGDRVWSRNQVTGEEGWQTVKHLFIAQHTNVVHLRYNLARSDLSGEDDDASGQLTGTADHPFWSMDRKMWVLMGNLFEGERLLLAQESREAVVVSLEWEAAPKGESFTTYNFEVENWHSYFVAPVPDASAIWVHNSARKFQRLMARAKRTFDKRAPAQRLTDAEIDAWKKRFDKIKANPPEDTALWRRQVWDILSDMRIARNGNRKDRLEAARRLKSKYNPHRWTGNTEYRGWLSYNILGGTGRPIGDWRLLIKTRKDGSLQAVIKHAHDPRGVHRTIHILKGKL